MKSKKSLSLVAAIILSFSFILGSCSSKQEEKKVVIAQVNGEDIFYDEFYDIYNYTLTNQGIDPETEDEEELDLIEKMKDELLEDLITRKVMKQKITAEGYEITDETRKEAEEQYNYSIEMFAFQTQLQAQFQGEEGAEDRDFKKEAEEFVLEQLELMNRTKDDYLEDIAEEILISKYLEDLAKDIEALEEEIRSFYDEELEMQEAGGRGEVNLVKNPDQTRVKHILIGLAEEDKKEYENYYQEGKYEEAESFLEEKLAEIKPKAEEVLEKAKNGEDFEALIDEYGEDPGMESEDYKDGYLVNKGSGFVPEFEETSLNLEVDEISDLVPTMHGYHIIKAYEKFEEAIFTFEEKRDEIKEILDREKKSEFAIKEVDRWVEEAEIVKHRDKI
ncbi:MAG TPA: peptidylprolyl isomerase [Clostridium sp.]|nr:peptidylprolyl isomerase [Clostridium sp.]